MAINLHDKYAKQIQTAFTTESLIAGRLSTEYSFAGVRTVKISTPQTVPMNDYRRSGTNRYGDPVEMQDTVQELTLTQDKSFSLTVDKGNNADQNGIKAAGKMLALQLKEQAIPEMDKYMLSALAHKAGKIVGVSTTLSKSNICDRISDGTLYMDDHEVPQENRTLFISNAAYKFLKQSGADLNNESVNKKAWVKGQVAEYDNMRVIKVPSGRMPANVNFMIVYKNSATAPVKLSETKLHQDPPGLSGNLMEGREYYDCFVFGVKSDGVYVEVDTASGKGTITATPTITAASGAITCTDSSATIVYTTDGTDPRYSSTTKTGSSAGTGKGTVVKAYAYEDGKYPSEVATVTLTA